MGDLKLTLEMLREARAQGTPVTLNLGIYSGRMRVSSTLLEGDGIPASLSIWIILPNRILIPKALVPRVTMTICGGGGHPYVFHNISYIDAENALEELSNPNESFLRDCFTPLSLGGQSLDEVRQRVERSGYDPRIRLTLSGSSYVGKLGVFLYYNPATINIEIDPKDVGKLPEVLRERIALADLSESYIQTSEFYKLYTFSGFGIDEWLEVGAEAEKAIGPYLNSLT